MAIFPSVKTNLIVKVQCKEKARDIFRRTGVNITTDRKRYLGGAIGTRSFTEDFLKSRVKEWLKEVEQLSQNCKITTALCFRWLHPRFGWSLDLSLQVVRSIWKTAATTR